MIGFALPFAFFLLFPSAIVVLYTYWRSLRSLRFIEANSVPQRRAGLTILNPRSHALLFLSHFLLSCVVVIAVASPYVQGEGAVTNANGRVLVFIDASLSMQARDITEAGRSVSRLEFAKGIAEGIIEKAVARGINLRTGLYSFAGTVVVHSPPSDDREAVRSVLQALGATTSYVNTGSSLSAVLAAIRSQAAHAAPDETIQAVIIGDGEIPEGYEDRYDEDLDALEAAGVPVHCITVGQEKGTTITLYDPAERARNPGGHIKPLGKAETARDDEHYERIADGTGGSFAAVDETASADAAIEEIMNGLAEKAERPGAADPDARKDLTPYVMVFFAVLLLLESLGLSFLRIRRLPFLLLPLMLGCDRFTSHMYNEKGILLEKIDVARAEEQYERARLYASGAGTALANLGSLVGDSRDFASAHTLFEASIKIEFDRPTVHYEDGRLLVLWALHEAEECRPDRAKELMDVSSQRFEAAVSLSKERGPIRRFYERHLLQEPEVEDRAAAALAELTAQRRSIEEIQKECPPPEKQEEKQEKPDPNKSEQNNTGKGTEKEPRNKNENEQESNESGKTPGLRGSVTPSDEVNARLEQLKSQNRGEFKQSRQQQGMGSEKREEGEKGRPDGHPIWW